jgi:hypothetical protein
MPSDMQASLRPKVVLAVATVAQGVPAPMMQQALVNSHANDLFNCFTNGYVE